MDVPYRQPMAEASGETPIPVYPDHLCGYALLTLVVLAKVWYDTSQSRNHMTIDHIRHPALKSKKQYRIAYSPL